jgi:uncharacterized membrane protein HdeD (DUF308 family)
MSANHKTSENKNPVWNWLRWVAVLPAAIGAYFGVQIVVGLAMVYANGLDDSPDYKSQLICSIVGPCSLVLAGAKTAPKFRFVTALTLTVLHAIYSGALVTLAMVRVATQSASLWWLILSGVIGIIASIATCIQIRKEEDNSSVRAL